MQLVTFQFFSFFEGKTTASQTPSGVMPVIHKGQHKIKAFPRLSMTSLRFEGSFLFAPKPLKELGCAPFLFFLPHVNKG